nr:MAG TPA: hypothetical protein [Caudoviricetes sp.]
MGLWRSRSVWLSGKRVELARSRSRSFQLWQHCR